MRYLRYGDLEPALNAADLVVVGAGLTGLTVAERVWNRLGKRVVVIERRHHPGGNAWSEVDEATGIEVHRYGAHIFHTSNEKAWSYVNRFSGFNGYRHTVWTNHKGQRYPLPINLQTISMLAGRALAPWEAREWVAAHRPVRMPGFEARNLEEWAIMAVGRRAYEALIAEYTEKQWDIPPSQLPAAVIARLPVRYDLNQRYFNDKYEGLPLNGYHGLVENLADWRGVDVALGVDWADVRELLENHISAGNEPTPIVYTGPVDQFFQYRHGHLGWRTVDLELETLNTGDHQGAAVVNEADLHVPYTRTHEFRHLHPERELGGWGGGHHPEKTVIARERSRYAGTGDEPYYPIGSPRDREMLKRYRDEAVKLPDVVFAGRLGTYKYLDMHQAIAGALTLFDNVLEPYFLRGEPLKKRGDEESERDAEAGEDE